MWNEEAEIPTTIVNCYQSDVEPQTSTTENTKDDMLEPSCPKCYRVLNDLICPICLCVMFNVRIFSCREGHNICGPCLINLCARGKVCPICKSSTVQTRNRFAEFCLETISDEGLGLSCRFKSQGCIYSGLHRDVKCHEQFCLWRPSKCCGTVSNNPCDFSGLLEHVIAHIRQTARKPFPCSDIIYPGWGSYIRDYSHRVFQRYSYVITEEHALHRGYSFFKCSHFWRPIFLSTKSFNMPLFANLIMFQDGAGSLWLGVYAYADRGELDHWQFDLTVLPAPVLPRDIQLCSEKDFRGCILNIRWNTSSRWCFRGRPEAADDLPRVSMNQCLILGTKQLQKLKRGSLLFSFDLVISRHAEPVY